MPGLLAGRALLHGLRALTLRRRLAVPAVVLALACAQTLVTAPARGQDAAQSGPQPPVPWIRLDPDCDDPQGGQEVQVLGSGFEPRSDVDIFLLAPPSGPVLLSGDLRPVTGSAARARTAQSTPRVADARVDQLGTFSTSFRMPAVDPFGDSASATIPLGDYEVRAETRGGGPRRTEILTVPCEPTLTVDTGCRPAPGGQAPERIVVQGQHFVPGDDQINVVVWSPVDGGGSLRERPARADGSGSFRVEFRVGSFDPGTYRVSATSQLDYGARAWFETPCPTLDVAITPDCGPPGRPPERMSIRVEASGFLRRQRAFVIFDTPRSYEVFPVRTDPDGNLVADIAPYRRGEGSLAVRVRTEDGDSQVVRQRSVPFTIPCEGIEAELSATECRRPAIEGEEEWRWGIELTGRSFRPGEVAVVFDAGGIVGAQRFVLEADEGGRLADTITPVAGPSGRYRIVARQAGGGTPAEAGVAAIRGVNGQTTFRAPCSEREPPPAPAIVDICGPEAPGQQGAYDITVSGEGFYAGGVVRIAFGSGRDSQVFNADTVDGSYERTITPDGRAEGSYPVRVSQRDSARNVLATSRRATFTVPCPIDPTITFVQGQGPAGYTVRVEGRDFEPQTIVTLTWDRGLQAGIPTPVQVGDDGTFDVYVFILPNDWPGERTLTAGRPDDPAAFPEATDDYLVVPGSGIPPGPEAGGIVDRR